MPNNPLQIVLNTNDFQRVPEVKGGGKVKDFFKGRNQAFASHRQQLLNDLDRIGRAMTHDERPVLSYMHVTLNEDAWAKSHRPTVKLMPPAKVPLVGGTNLGDMIVELTPDNIATIRAGINDAEEEVRLVQNKDTKQLEPKPSRARGEVGAIRSLRTHHATDRRSFSAEEAIAWLSDPRTGGMYLVETFIDPRRITDAPSRQLRRRALQAFGDLQQSLAQLSLPLTVEDTGDRWKSVRLLVLRLQSQKLADHEALLRFLDAQSIVRRVSLPPVLEVEHTAAGSAGQPATIAPPNAGAAHPVLGIIDTGIAPVSSLEAWCVGRTDLIPGDEQNRAHGTFIAGLTAAAQVFNAHPIFAEVPCQFFDLGLYPTLSDVYDDVYPRGFLDFL